MKLAVGCAGIYFTFLTNLDILLKLYLLAMFFATFLFNSYDLLINLCSRALCQEWFCILIIFPATQCDDFIFHLVDRELGFTFSFSISKHQWHHEILYNGLRAALKRIWLIVLSLLLFCSILIMILQLDNCSCSFQTCWLSKISVNCIDSLSALIVCHSCIQIDTLGII